MVYDFQATMDCVDPHALADWWAEVLGWVVEPQDEDFIRSMIAQGHATQADAITHRGRLVWRVGAALCLPDQLDRPDRRRILFQAVPESKTVKNRMHLDVRVGAEAREREVERIVGIGATVLHRGRQGRNEWVTVADPEGNEFCIA
jgi:hypothetical protein